MSLIKQKGASTVEFAMLLPLLLLLIVMVSEFGILFYRLNAVTKSVQIAARYLTDVSVNNGYTGTQADNARNLAVYGTIAGNGTPVVPNLEPGNITVTDLGEHVRVSATYDADLVLGNALNALVNMVTGGSAPSDFMTLRASSVMRFTQ